MSAFLGFESYLISLGSTLQQIQDTFKNTLISRNWRCINEAYPPISMTSTTPYSGTAASCFDNDYSSILVMNAALPNFVNMQLAAGFTPVFMNLANGLTLTESPVNFSLDWSDNGSAWTTHQSWTGEQWYGLYEQHRYAITGAGSHAYWRLQVTARNGAGYTDIGLFTLEDAAGRVTSSVQFIDMLGPATETFGTALSRELTRIEIVNGTTITIRPILQYLQSIKQTIGIWPKTAGAVQAGVTINGVTVQQDIGTVNAGNTAAQNHRYLYEALRASADVNFTDYTWEYQPLAAQNADDTNQWIYGVKKTDGSKAITPNANINAATLGIYCPAGITNYRTVPQVSTLTIDTTNGFIYYLQVNARSLALATKTNSAYYGPVHACWADNAKAVACIPPSGWAQPCSIIELVVGTDDVVANTSSFGRISHWWGMFTTTPGGVQAMNSNQPGHPTSGFLARNKIQDNMTAGISYMPNRASDYITLAGSNFFAGADLVGNDFQIHRMGAIGETQLYAGISPGYGRCVAPVLDVPDWYKFCGTAADEALVMVADTVQLTTLTADLAVGAVTIPVVSTTGFASSGYVVIENEIIQYTGITSNSFTGCTRSRFGTVAYNHYNGDTCAQGLWFTKINGGALYCGTTKPT